MNAKKNLQASMNHRQQERLVVDFGSTGVTGIHIKWLTTAQSGKEMKHYLLMLLSLLLLAPSYAQDFKWYPGHYILLPARSERSVLVSRSEELASYQIVRGFQIRYYWDDLEPSKDNYNFSKIIDDLNYVQSQGKLLVVQIQSKTFNNNQLWFPSYLLTPEYDGGVYQMKGGGYNLRLWNEDVLNRFKALITALGAAIDSHTALALFNLEESATAEPVDDELLSGWTNRRRLFMEGFASCGYTNRAAFPTTPTISYFNSSASEALLFEASALASGNGDGGPDIYVGAYEKQLSLMHSYDLTKRLAGKVPVGYAVQWHNYTWEGGPNMDPDGVVPPVKHYEFARDELKANFIFWIRRTPYWNDVKALLSNLSFLGDPAGGLHTGCPQLAPPHCSAPSGSISPTGNELLVMDFNRPVTQEDRGFPGAEKEPVSGSPAERILPGSNENWELPVNFAEGTLHFRTLIRRQPVAQEMSLKFCISQDDVLGVPAGLEACSPLKPISGNSGTIVSWSVPVESLTKKDGNPLDWTRSRERFSFSINNLNGEPVSDLDGWNWQGEDPGDWYPLDMRFTVVAVAKGQAFSGWNNYIWEEFTPNDTTPIERGLAAYWSFDDLAVGKIPDASGSENHLSLSGQASLQPGKYGNAMSLPGGNQSYALIDEVNLSRDFPSSNKGLDVDSFSIACWIKLNSIDERSTIITKEIQNKRGFEFAVKNGYLSVQIFKDELSGSRVEGTNTRLQTGEWYHVGMSYNYVNDGNSVVKLYLNGELDEMINNCRGPQKKNDAAVRVGHYIWGTNFQRFFNGMIDELYVYNKVLSQDQIQSLMDPEGIPNQISVTFNKEGSLRVYPNPVSEMGYLEFEMINREHVNIGLFNIQGKEVASLVHRTMEPGRHTLHFDYGSLPSGFYYCRLKKRSEVEVIRIVKY